ncbi:hypothetical protein AHAS_Ahas18G0278500 [Arachis hypogaea]
MSETDLQKTGDKTGRTGKPYEPAGFLSLPFSLRTRNPIAATFKLQNACQPPPLSAADSDNPLEVWFAYGSHRRSSTPSWTSLIVVAHARSLLIGVFLLRLYSLSLFLIAQSLLPLILDSDPLIKPWQIPHLIQSMMAFADIFLR